jgi:hypothetical protein
VVGVVVVCAPAAGAKTTLATAATIRRRSKRADPCKAAEMIAMALAV